MHIARIQREMERTSRNRNREPICNIPNRCNATTKTLPIYNENCKWCANRRYLCTCSHTPDANEEQKKNIYILHFDINTLPTYALSLQINFLTWSIPCWRFFRAIRVHHFVIFTYKIERLCDFGYVIFIISITLALCHAFSIRKMGEKMQQNLLTLLQ